MVVKDLESLLEGLVDKLAMWQVISGLQNQLPTQSTNSSSFQNNSHLPVDLDQVQRFWTDVIEEQLSFFQGSYPFFFRIQKVDIQTERF